MRMAHLGLEENKGDLLEADFRTASCLSVVTSGLARDTCGIADQ